MYGARDAPQISGEPVKHKMTSLGFVASDFHPSVYSHLYRGVTVVAHVDAFLCIGSLAELEWLCVELKKKHDLKKHMLEGGNGQEVKYLNKVLRRGTGVSRLIPSMRGRC